MSNNTQIYGIIGKNIDYSLSPAIYRELFALKRLAAIYNIFNLEDSELVQFVNAVRLLNIGAFNVTTPHKRGMLEYLDKPDKLSVATQSVNLVINRKGTLYGYNTDYEGIRQSIEKEFKFDVKGTEVAIIGSGGAAHTAYSYLVGCKPKRITVYHHSAAGLLSFGAFARRTQRFACYHPVLMAGKIDAICGYDLCINCTPASVTDLIADKSVAGLKRIFELRYGKYPLIKRNHIRGNYMLAVQAAANFKIMTGIAVSANRIMKIIDGVLEHD